MPVRRGPIVRTRPVTSRMLRLTTTALACLVILEVPVTHVAGAAPMKGEHVIAASTPGNRQAHLRAAMPHQPSTAQGLRLGARRGCWFASQSARLSRPCERTLRAAVKRLARGTRVSVIGVAIDGASAAVNRTLAKRRARAVVLYLRAIGVRGKLRRATVIARGGGSSLGRVLVIGGSPRTTVVFGGRR